MTTLPIIHLNGTSAQSLCEEYHKARMAVWGAIEEIQQTTCNARDFYCHPDALAWERARQEREDAFAKLREVEEYLLAWEEHAAERIR